MADRVDTILRDAPHIQAIAAPELGDIMQETEATPYNYPKSWGDGVDDPWLVFHTSGTTGRLTSCLPQAQVRLITTTGNPKPVTLTQKMLAVSDRTASMPDLQPSIFDQLALRKWYTPLHVVHVRSFSMKLVISNHSHGAGLLGQS